MEADAGPAADQLVAAMNAALDQVAAYAETAFGNVENSATDSMDQVARATSEAAAQAAGSAENIAAAYQQAGEQAASSTSGVGAAWQQAGSQSERAMGNVRDANGRLRDANGRYVREVQDGATAVAGATRQMGDGFDRAARDVEGSGGRIGGVFDRIKGSTLGWVAGAVSAGAAVRSILSTGMDFTSSLNTMQAVSQATAGQMREVSEAARDLANDTTLPATSATDAAAAMVELAKGGFSVQQSMTAARGTLQLAAAAQIDAATAATIQSQALQAFGQDASFAGTAADVLANAANASSAEITDVAQALQQGGTVANQFGLTMQETAAAIALMANAGIQGSDAGTLLKSTLLAVTDQGKPAQAAIDELGLSVYDANGEFAGMSVLFRELNAASKQMTDEQYQAATATLFGSDAMRLSGLAAQFGAEGYDKMVDAMGRTGSAAEVAAAQTQGLPGAWERFKNAVESASLSAYDAVQGPLTSAANGAAGFIGDLEDAAKRAAPAVGDFFSGVGDKIQNAYQALDDSGKLDEWGDRAMAIFTSLVESGKELVPTLETVSRTAAKVAGALTMSGLEALLAALETGAVIVDTVFVPALQILTAVLNVSDNAFALVVAGIIALRVAISATRAVYTPLASAMSTTNGHLRTAVVQTAAVVTANNAYVTSTGRVIQAQTLANARMAGAVAQLGRFGSGVAQLGTTVPVVARMQQAFISASTSASAMPRVMGTVSASLAGVRSAGSGLVGFLGGPWQAAFMAAIAIVGLFASSSMQAKSSQKAYEDALGNTREAQVNLTEALIESRGAMDKMSMDALTQQLDGVRKQYEAVEGQRQSFMNALGDTSTWKEALSFGIAESDYEKTGRAADQAKAAREAIEGLGMSSQVMAEKISGSFATWEQFKNQLIATGEGGKMAAEDFEEVRKQLLQQQELTRRTAPGFAELEQAMAKFADETASAADKSDALKLALDRLNPARTASEAMADYNETVRKTAEALQEAVAEADGFGASLGGVAGVLDGTTANGAALREQLLNIVDATAEVAAKGGDLNHASAENARVFGDLAKQYGLSIGDIQAAADQLGLSDIDLVVKASGAGEVIQELAGISASFANIPDGQPKIIEVEAGQLVPATREALDQIGFRIAEIEKGGVKTVEVIPETAEAQAQLAAVLQVVTNIPPGKEITVSAPGGQGVFDLMTALGVKVTTDNMKNIVVESPLAPQVLETLRQLGIAVRNDNGKQILVTDNGTAAQVQGQINGIQGKTVYIDYVGRLTASGTDPHLAQMMSDAMNDINNQPRADGAIVPRSVGAIVARAAGGMNVIDKPTSADIYAASGAGTLFAERETGGEAYIPLDPSKRARSEAILSEVARLFGGSYVKAMADGAVMGAAVSAGPTTTFGGGASWPELGQMVALLQQIVVNTTVGGGLGPTPDLAGAAVGAAAPPTAAPGGADPAAAAMAGAAGVTEGWQASADALTGIKEGQLDPSMQGLAQGVNDYAALTQTNLQTVVDPAWMTSATNLGLTKTTLLDPTMWGIQANTNATALATQNAVFAGINPAWQAMGGNVMAVKTGTVDPALAGMQGAVWNTANAFGAGAASIATQWNQVREATAAPVRFAIGAVFNDGIVGMWNSVSDLLGTQKMGTYPIRFATGGIVPGAGAEDKIPALVMPKEFVVPRGMAAAIGGGNLDRGLQMLDSVRQRGPTAGLGAEGLFSGIAGRYAAGGVVQGTPAWEAMKRGHAFAARWNGAPYVWGGSLGPDGGTDCSGYMSSIADVILGGSGLQRQWATGSFPGGGGTQGAGGPQGFVQGLGAGMSIGVSVEHTAGTLGGIDGLPTVNIESGGSHGNVAYGGPAVGADNSQFPSQYHLPIVAGAFMSGGGGGGSTMSMQDIVGGITGPAWDKIMSTAGSWTGGGLIGSYPSKLAEKMKGATTAKIDKLVQEMSTFADPGGAGVERWRPLVTLLLKRYSLGEENADRTLRRMNQESSGNPRAINLDDSNAKAGTPSKGLMQVIDPTFATHRDPALSADIWDPMANVGASMRYAMAQYGSLAAAYDKAGGYDRGGLAKGTGIMLKDVISPERVLDPQMTPLFDKFMSGLKMSGSGSVSFGGLTVTGSGEMRIDGDRVVGNFSGFAERDGKRVEVKVNQYFTAEDPRRTADEVQDRLLALLP